MDYHKFKENQYMENRNMMNLSPRECRERAKHIMANSERLWKNAGMQESGGDSGLGISLMVISTEELIKALVLTLDGAGFEFRKSANVKRFFTDHHIRHVTSFLLLSVYVFGNDAAALLKGRNFSANTVKGLIRLARGNNDRLSRFTKCYLARKMHLLQLELDWFADMETYRQNGFYYDYDNDPRAITSADFLIAYDKLEKVRKIALLFIESYRTVAPGDQKNLKNLLKSLRNGQVYGLLSIAIDTVKKNKSEAFDGLERIFSEFH